MINDDFSSLVVTTGLPAGMAQFLIANATMAIAMLVGPEHAFAYANTTYLRITGPHSQPIIGRTVREVFPLLSQQAHDTLAEVFGTGETRRLNEFQVLLPDGRATHWNSEHMAVRDAAGTVIGIAVLANEVTPLVEARREAERRATEAENARRLLSGLLRHLPEGITIAEPPDARIIAVSEHGCRIAGRTRDQMEGIPISMQPERWGILKVDGVTVPRPEELPLMRVTLGGEVIEGERWIIERPDGVKVPILCNAGPIYDDRGNIRFGVIAWRDITPVVEAENTLTAALGQKDMLVREINHRVKNSLQMVSSLLSLQRDKIADPQVRDLLSEAQNRVVIVGRIHQHLYQNGGDRIDLGHYLAELCRDIVYSSSSLPDPDMPLVHSDPVEVAMDIAIPLGLLVNELVVNCLKYAYPDGRGLIEVRLNRHVGGVELIVSDHGVGLPSGFDPDKSAGLGSRLILSLATQLGGSVEIQDARPGTRIRVAVPFE
jgi:PAS domain S-box-containing protein